MQTRAWISDGGGEHPSGRLGKEFPLVGSQLAIKPLHTKLFIHIKEHQRLKRIIPHLKTFLRHYVTEEAERTLDVGRRAGPGA